MRTVRNQQTMSKKNNSKEKPAKKAEVISAEVMLHGLPIVKEAHLITVKTISNRVVEQMEYIDGNAYDPQSKQKREFSGCEVVGRVAPYQTLIVRDKDTFYKMRAIAYIMWREQNGASNDKAQKEIRAYPQLFTT
jgi:hypothetical protein